MSTPQQTDLATRLAACALPLAAHTPWNNVTLSDICATCDVTLIDCAKALVTKATVTASLDDSIDHAMLAVQPNVDRTTGVRDRLFDVLMGRFDAMEDNRAAWTSILTSENDDLVANIARRGRRAHTGAWALEASGVSTNDLRGIGRAIGLARILRLVDAVWLNDGPELAKTMARLDQELRTSEAWVERAQSLSGFFGAKPAVEPTL